MMSVIKNTHSTQDLKKIHRFLNMLFFLKDIQIVDISGHVNFFPEKIHVRDVRKWVDIIRNFGCKVSDETR